MDKNIVDMIEAFDETRNYALDTYQRAYRDWVQNRIKQGLEPYPGTVYGFHAGYKAATQKALRLLRAQAEIATNHNERDILLDLCSYLRKAIL